LGASLEEKKNDVTTWLQGSGDDHGPELDEYLAESETRKEAAAKLVRAWKEQYAEVPNILMSEDVAEAKKHPTYEVFADVLDALTELLAVIDRQAKKGKW
jgi:hypothetical protein